jgi:Flp pilus assembly pilin Flp
MGGWQDPKGRAPMNFISRFLTNQTGATAVEYGLIAGATCLALGAMMPTLNSNLSEIYAKIGSYFN